MRRWSKVPRTYANEPVFKRTENQIRTLTCPGTKRYIITSAQNNTPLDIKFWQAIQNYAAYREAQVIVIPVMYRNPTAPGELESQDAWWPPEVEPFLVENDFKIGPGVRVLGDAKIAATAVSPLTGFESITGPDSAIFGHAQIQMKTVATPQNRLPKILQTTGSTSVKNYSKSKAGKKGDFHHSLGAVIIECDDELKISHIRGVVGDHDSEFYDLNLHATHKGVKKVEHVEAIITGDEHSAVMCPEVRDATYDREDSLGNLTKPKYIVRHDTNDSSTITHHHRHNPAIRYWKHITGNDLLKEELHGTRKLIEETTPPWATSVLVRSNHDDHILRWLEEVDWRTEPWNAEIYHDMWAAWLKAIREERDFHPFTWWMKENCKADVLYLTDDYPFIVKGIYLGYHGHRGANGAKGNIRGFSKIGAKTVIGHVHSPGIEKGCYQVGTSTLLKLEYTKGPSSWHNTHALIAPNGKRQLVNIIMGEYTA
jgi:hypothetical protein